MTREQLDLILEYIAVKCRIAIASHERQTSFRDNDRAQELISKLEDSIGEEE